MKRGKRWMRTSGPNLLFAPGSFFGYHIRAYRANFFQDEEDMVLQIRLRAQK